MLDLSSDGDKMPCAAKSTGSAGARGAVIERGES